MHISYNPLISEQDLAMPRKEDEPCAERMAINAAVQAHLGHLTHQQFTEFHLHFVHPIGDLPEANMVPTLEMARYPLTEMSDEELIKVRWSRNNTLSWFPIHPSGHAH